MLANILVETFHKGGPIMWPILVAFLAGFAVALERLIWWSRALGKSQRARLEEIFAAVHAGDMQRALGLSENAETPAVRVVHQGLRHAGGSLENALQLAAGVELQKAGRFLPVLDTLITLAPLLGLLGTVTGIMDSFKFVGASELAVTKVSGGIGEALIATAAGLGIAIFCLIPFNFFTARVAKLQYEIETAATNLQLLLDAPRSGAAQ